MPKKQHGLSRTKEYYAWKAMLLRCGNPKDNGYGNYGGRGISVCQRWQSSFLAFLDDVGAAPHPDSQLDRIDNDGNYEPENCRWVSRFEQLANTRQAIKIKHMGEEMCITAWAKILGFRPGTLMMRYKYGDRDPSVLFRPLNKRKSPQE